MCDGYKASIIIPVYRAEKTLRRCVESILYGTERNVQVILVDDCSPDGSWEVCQALAAEHNQHVLCLRNEQNSGVSFTRNRGLSYAQAEYILFVDSDDWVSGSYVEEMLRFVHQNESALTVCGYVFIDLPNKSRRVYRYDAEGSAVSVYMIENPFELEKRILIQQLWNKVFRRSIIREHRIAFDEQLSMGEDFKFVLDYLEAGEIHKFFVLDYPLYYYIRYSCHSLMSTWLDLPFEERIKPYHRMAQLMEDRNLAKMEDDQAVARIKNSVIYQIASKRIGDRVRKKELLRQFMQNDSDRRQYRRVQLSVMKERAYTALMQARRIPVRARAKINREYLYPRKLKKLRKKLTAERFSLICQNCIGGVFYHEMGMQFLSPTINLFIREPDFIRFVSRLEDYLKEELVMSWEEEYPVGILRDVRIDFMHYDTCTQAKVDWERRKSRILKNRIVVMATDRNGFDGECFEQWKCLPYKKILFTANPAYAKEDGSVYYPECEKDGFVDNIIDRKAFYRHDTIFRIINALDSQ